MKRSRIKSDLSLEEEGKWFPYVDGFRVRIRSIRSTFYKETAERIGRPHKRELKRGDAADQATVRRVSQEAVAEGLIADWSGYEEDDGSPIPYSKEEAVRLCTEQEYREFYEWVTTCAADAEEFRVGNPEDEGNSESA